METIGGASWTCPLLSRVSNVLVCVEESSYVECLSSPQIPVDGPVEGELQRASIEGPEERCDQLAAQLSHGLDLRYCLLGRHLDLLCRSCLAVTMSFLDFVDSKLQSADLLSHENCRLVVGVRAVRREGR